MGTRCAPGNSRCALPGTKEDRVLSLGVHRRNLRRILVGTVGGIQVHVHRVLPVYLERRSLGNNPSLGCGHSWISLN